MAYDDAMVPGRGSGASDNVRFGSRRTTRGRTADRTAGYRGTRHREPEESAPAQPDVASTGWTQRGSHRQEPTDRHAAYRRQPDAGPEVEYAMTEPPALDDVFDDPEQGEPGRDRMGVHVAWEVVLLGAAVALAYLVYREDPAVVRGAALQGLLLSATALGLLALAAGLTLRAGVPNLALGPVAVAAALHYAENSDQGMPFAVGNPLIVATVGGLALAVLVVGLHVPAWAGTLGGALGVLTFIQLRPAPVNVQGGFDPGPRALYLFGGFAVLAVVGGLIGSRHGLRRQLGRFRPVSDPADRRGGVAGAVAGGALLVSVLLAVAAGVLLAASTDGPVAPVSGFEWTGLAIGTALVAGTSAFGRRGGVFGTLFAVVGVTLFRQYEQQQDLHISLAAIAAGLVGAGLLVTRLVEAYGRPLRAYAAGPAGLESAAAPLADPSDVQSGYERWSPASPIQPASTETDRWGDQRWGSSTS